MNTKTKRIASAMANLKLIAAYGGLTVIGLFIVTSLLRVGEDPTITQMKELRLQQVEHDYQEMVAKKEWEKAMEEKKVAEEKAFSAREENVQLENRMQSIINGVSKVEEGKE